MTTKDKNIYRRFTSPPIFHSLIACDINCCPRFYNLSFSSRYLIDFRFTFIRRKAIGHFTAIVNEKSTRIGCSLVRFQKSGFKFLYLVCNYSWNNFLGEPIYTAGPAASKCQKGRHRVYESLCNENEIIITWNTVDELKSMWNKCSLRLEIQSVQK